MILISIVGATVVVFGLYLVVWGKSKEYKSHMQPSPAKEQEQQQLPVTTLINDYSNGNKAQLVIHSDEKSDVEATISKTQNQQH